MTRDELRTGLCNLLSEAYADGYRAADDDRLILSMGEQVAELGHKAMRLVDAWDNGLTDDEQK